MKGKMWLLVLVNILFFGIGLDVLAHEGVTEEELLFKEIPMVFVASQQSEPLEESPVISNIITAEEIKRMGARTLNDVLLTIPGFSHIQDHNEYFSAERGIYASSQQKILVLRNGHRLNSRSYNEANFDYAISLDNVKRIEVLRGPGGSLYGDVALTAVVNIITKEGKDINGVQTTVGYGNYGQKKAGIVSGKDFGNGMQVVFSGTYYENDGQKMSWNDPRSPAAAGESVVYGFKDKPSFDTYLHFSVDKLGITFSKRYSHYIEPRSGGGITGEIYDINSFAEFDGELPGLSSDFDHFEVAYSPEFGGYKSSSKVYFDRFKLRANLVLVSSTKKQGDLHWDEQTGGLQSQISKDYSFFGKGTVLLGIQAEQMDVFDSRFATGIYPNMTISDTAVLLLGKENTYAVFNQFKHNIREDLILNFGARYDYKKRKEYSNVKNLDQVSPRAAVIYTPVYNLSLRLSYAHSFVDAPYWYRYNTMPSYQGASTLEPEKMDSYQFSVENKLTDSFSQRLNIFVNDFTDVVFRDVGGVYTNAGAVKSNGTEYELGFKKKNISIRSNYTYQVTDKAVGFSSKGHMLENVPKHMGNAIVDYAPLHNAEDITWIRSLWLNLSLKYVGKQYSRWGKTLTDPEDTVNDVWITNAGFTINEFITKNMSFGFHAYNLFDKKYYQGGSIEYPYLQPGLWYMANLTYKF